MEREPGGGSSSSPGGGWSGNRGGSSSSPGVGGWSRARGGDTCIIAPGLTSGGNLGVDLIVANVGGDPH